MFPDYFTVSSDYGVSNKVDCFPFKKPVMVDDLTTKLTENNLCYSYYLQIFS